MSNPTIKIEVTADVNPARRQLGRLQNAVKEAGNAGLNAKSAFGHVKGSLMAMGAAAAGITGALYAVKKAMDYGREGAVILDTADKLDRLAVSIGTTSDAIIYDLGDAMGGLMSDAEMVSSASEIISLGLADNQEDVVRLASLVGKLGWDMQTVILTFANNSKMRLDSLGLSVTDVEDRMKALEEQGYDTDKAFDLAVMEAGEAKLNLLGDAADKHTASFDRLNAHIKNFIDGLKTQAEPRLESFANALNTWFDFHAVQDEFDRLIEQVGYYDEEVADGASERIKAIQEEHGAWVDFTEQQVEIEALKDEIENLQDAERDHQRILDKESAAHWDYLRSISNSSEVTHDMIPEVDSLTESTILMNQAFGSAVTGAEDMYWANAELADSVSAVEARYDDLSTLMKDDLSKAAEEFNEQQTQLKDEAWEIQKRIDELNDLSYLTPQQRGELDTLYGELGEINQAIDGNATAHEEATRRILFSLLQQRIALDGVTEDEMALANEVALAWGLIDQDTYAAVTAIDGYLKELASESGPPIDELAGKVAQLSGNLKDLPMQKRIEIIMETTSYTSTYAPTGGMGLPEYQHGAWEIPQTQIAQIHQGEMVLPPNVAERVRESVRNNYNLTINTNAPAESALSDFHIMAALAGA